MNTNRQPDEAEVRKSWNKGADAWNEFIESGNDYYRLEVHGPALLQACGDVRGLRVLDMGCGQGRFSRELARKGARVIGVDIAEKQIEFALRHEEKQRLGIEYRVMDATRARDHWPGASFDTVTASMVFGDMEDAEGAFRSAYQVLKDRGRLVFSDAHPCTNTAFHEWERDAKGEKKALKIDRYSETGAWTCHWNMKRLKYHWDTPAWRRTLSEWSETIAKTGFLIRRIYEPRPTKEQVKKRPELDDCYRLPYFLVFDLVKSG